MTGLAHWLSSSLLYGTALFALAWVLSVTVLKTAHPAARALMFGLVLIKFVVPFGASLPIAQAPSEAPTMALTVTVLQSGTADRSIPWTDVLLLTWIAGVAAIALRRIWRHVSLLRSLGPAVEPSVRVRELAGKLGVRAPLVSFEPHALAESLDARSSTDARSTDALSTSAEGESAPRALGPCLVGVWRPVLVLPAEASGEDFDAMVVHELMHLRRRDPLWRALQAVVETLFFFWPVVRLASRQLSLAREEACDLAVVESGVIGRARYAEVLLQLGLESSSSLAMAAQPSHLERRIQMVLSGKKLRPMWLVVAVLAIAGLAGASASVWSDPDPTSLPRAESKYFTQPTPVRLSVKGGTIDERILNTLMITDRSVIDNCYLAFLADHPGVSGSVQLHFTVKTDGSIGGQCQEVETTLPIEVGRCISDRLQLMNFPRPLGMEDVELQYRFDFVAPPNQAQPSGTPT